MRLLQCTNVLASVRSDDENQQKVDDLVKAMKNTWLSRPRAAKDRRGFVVGRSENK